MTTQTLSHVTLQTLDNYRTAATQGVAAYRLGGHRLVGAVNGALTERLYPRTAQVAPRVTEQMDEWRDAVSKAVVEGIDRVAGDTEKVIEASSNTAADQVTRLARLATGIDNEFVANGLQAAVRFAMPGAKLGLMISGRIAEGATALADAAGARTVRRAARSAVTTTKRAVAPARRKAQSAAKAVKAAPKRAAKAASRVTRRAKAAVAEVAAA